MRHGDIHNNLITGLYPAGGAVFETIPPISRKFIQHEVDNLRVSVAAPVMAVSTVDAMLKGLRYVDSCVYDRIQAVVADRKLTEGMRKWAQSVRLGANRPRHADAENPHVVPEEVQQAIEFTTALSDFLFV
jgi:hypothetical protein